MTASAHPDDVAEWMGLDTDVEAVILDLAARPTSMSTPLAS